MKQDPAAQQALASRAAQMGIGDYTAVVAVVVRSGPSTSTDRVGALSKGQRVHGLADPAAGEWRKIALGDGTGGYVPAKYLSEKTKPAAAAPVPATAVAPPAATSRNVQVAVAATETIPEKRVAYSKSVDDATKQSNLSFDLDQNS